MKYILDHLGRMPVVVESLSGFENKIKNGLDLVFLDFMSPNSVFDSFLNRIIILSMYIKI